MTKCLYCSKELEKNNFCNGTCRNKYRTKNHSHNFQKIGVCSKCNKTMVSVNLKRHEPNCFPKICPQCNQTFFHRDKKFCSQSCSATYNNSHREKLQRILYCEKCQIQLPENSWYKRKYCDSCLKIIHAVRKSSKIKIDIIDIDINNPIINTISNTTKAEHFANYKSWQTARSLIRSHAARNFKQHNPILKCQNCNYNKYVEVCHIKSVSSFSPETKVSEINDITNLLGLCPNCHWEYDNGLLKLESIKAPKLGLEPRLKD